MGTRSVRTSNAVWRITPLIWHDLRLIVQGVVDLAEWLSPPRAWRAALHERPRKRSFQRDHIPEVSAYGGDRGQAARLIYPDVNPAAHHPRVGKGGVPPLVACAKFLLHEGQRIGVQLQLKVRGPAGKDRHQLVQRVVLEAERIPKSLR